ncbi:uncharacterized protein LOC122026808 [Zingiber officinale]|uniref:uncharacterized protein LOC122026808 n=1 Tax=Zingiber officinale TaxID=94328 RepID=UPI001C4BAF8D|nr:uncharacterized protein LOC122026808 [Zingiber officinale]
MNPQKCLFGAKRGCFLGYIVTERGIEANSSKVKALQDMPPPRNLKEVQRLTGRITALSRFISRMADWSLPFFKILRRATKFQWDEECDQAFEELKVYLNSLPVLAKPVIGEPLRIYLSSTEHAVGLAFVRLDDEEQSVYFLSHILKDAESRYIGLEKLAFTLVLAARRLRPYFLAYTIIVMTNSPLGRVLLNPEASGRLIKWTTKLSKFNIQYQPRSVIKVQALADFITEVQNLEPEALRKIFVDRSSTRLGSGISVLMLSPQEERMHLSVRLDYRATNNEAEYESLIAGLQAARHVGANRVILYSDSQLPAQQLSGAFEINNARLRLYAEAFDKLKTNFGEVVVQKVPRAENQAADELAKLASSISSVVIQQPIEQMVKKFIWQHIICRFGIPRCLVSDNERQFIGQELREWCEGYGIQKHFTSVAYPQSNGQVEVANREILRILRVRLDHIGGSWVDELPGVLWAIHKTPKEGAGVTPFHLVYGGEAVVPVEVSVESDRIQSYDGDNVERRLLELDLIDAVRAKAVVRLTAYRQRMKQNYNRRVIPRAFHVGDLVWKKVKSIGDVSKLEAPWTWPFKVIEKL